jgi:hypothetical protein
MRRGYAVAMSHWRATMTRGKRRQELVEMMYTRGGPEKIGELYKQAIDMPPEQSVPPRILLRRDMIPAILLKEFPRC